MALRSILELKRDVQDWRNVSDSKYGVCCNVERILATPDPVTHKYWLFDRACPLPWIDVRYREIYGDTLSEKVEKLWSVSLIDWVRLFAFFELVEVDGVQGVIFCPSPEDVIVDCYNDPPVRRAFTEINVDSDWSEWNRCKVCGQVNSYFCLKYELIACSNRDIIEKWCRFIHDGVLASNLADIGEYIYHFCAKCHYVDCPFAWKPFDNNGGNGKTTPIGAISFADSTSALRRYCNEYNNSNLLSDLTRSIEPEDWGVGWTVLRNYLDLTFYNQSVHRNKNKGFLESDEYGWFNTGLLTQNALEEVYMCFGKDKNYKVTFFGFTWAGNPNGIYTKFLKAFGATPQYVPFVKQRGELLWDDSCKLELDADHFDHIFFDRYERWAGCRSFLQGRCGFDIIDVDRCWLHEISRDKKTRRKRFFEESDEHKIFFGNVQKLIRNSILQAQKKVVRDYKWALPIFYPANRMLTIGLPLFLNETGTGDVPDVVLACVKRYDAKCGEWRYYANTILKNSQIYNNARQVSKPHCEWLSRMLRLEDRKDTPMEITPSFDFIGDNEGAKTDLEQRFDERFGLLNDECLCEGVVCDFPYGKNFGWIRSSRGKIRFNVHDIKSGCDLKPGDRVRFEIVQRNVTNARQVVRIV